MATITTQPPRFCGVGIGLGPDRVVMVAGVGGIDGDERDVAQILAALEFGLLGGFGLGKHGSREDIGDAVGMDGDQADGLLRLRIAEPLDDAGGRHAIARPSAAPSRSGPARRPRPRRSRRAAPSILSAASCRSDR